MSSAIQLSFTLRTTPGVRTLHLLGSWDNYQNQLPMSQDPSKSAGGWAGTFRFQPGSLTPGQRYWYYYIMDGYHVTHDPAMASVVEPTTQRKLNILDVPGSTSSSSSKRQSTSSRSKRSSRRMSIDVATGRSLSPSQIKSPKPYKPGQTQQIVNYDLNALEHQFAATHIAEESSGEDSDYDGSDVSSDVPSLTSRSSHSSSPSSVSSGSSASRYCSCERYGITRSGNRIKLDCGGKRCGGYGYSDNGSTCSSESEEDVYHARATRRHGVVIRGR